MTAVEWFFNEIKHILPNEFLVKYEQAKEIEKKIIAQAFEDGDFNMYITMLAIILELSLLYWAGLFD